MTSRIAVQNYSGLCGAEVSGVDLAAASDSEFEQVLAAFRDHGVLFFRDQHLSPEQHIALAERFGPIDINRFFPADGQYPEIAEVKKDPGQTTNIGGGWHTDHSYDAVPAMGSILVARELPETGGDTLFASMYAAYEGLSPGLKRTLEGMRAVHSNHHVFGAAGVYKQEGDAGALFRNESLTSEATHPVVITHPLSGRKALYVNPGFTIRFEDWTPEESAALLTHLYRHATRPEYTCRFRWSEGAVAIWDNRCTWHYALNDYHGQRRLLHRITVAGCPLH
ncbi:MAG: TauD/TfdA family dioxygenase [Gammaproteobacteria bacterium]|nr:MAG: TauD/TfdA family dioxygenase [Gammaproteobacteria bacterium]